MINNLNKALLNNIRKRFLGTKNIRGEGQAAEYDDGEPKKCFRQNFVGNIATFILSYRSSFLVIKIDGVRKFSIKVKVDARRARLSREMKDDLK